MTDIPVQNYQEEQALEPVEPENAQIATIGEVLEEGVTLIFDGNEKPTKKLYKVNTSVRFHPGDRVKIFRDSKTYVVEYVIGNPAPEDAGAVELAKRAFTADNATTLGAEKRSEGQLRVAYAAEAGKAGSADTAGSADKAGSANEAVQAKKALAVYFNDYLFQLRINNSWIQIQEVGVYNTGWRNLLNLASNT